MKSRMKDFTEQKKVAGILCVLAMPFDDTLHPFRQIKFHLPLPFLSLSLSSPTAQYFILHTATLKCY